MRDSVAINELKRILDHIDGPIPSRASLFDPVIENPKAPAASFEANLLALSKTKHAYRLLLELEKALRPAIAEASEGLLEPSRQFGISKLPDHILAIIFDFAVREESFWDDGPRPPQMFCFFAHKQLRALALTSKRFLAIASASATLWAYIGDSFLSPARFDAQVARSKGARLSFDLETTTRALRERRLPAFISRCRALHLEISDAHAKGANGADLRHPVTASHSLPAIESFSVRGLSDPHVFFETWHLPNLKHLYIAHVLPPQQGLALARLTTLDIHYRRRLGASTVFAIPLLEFAQHIRAAPALRRLALTFNETCLVRRDTDGKLHGASDPELRALARPPLALPHLASLTLAADACKLVFGTYARRTVERLCEAMHVPALRSLELLYPPCEAPPAGQDQGQTSMNPAPPFRRQKLENLQTLVLKVAHRVQEPPTKSKSKKSKSSRKGGCGEGEEGSERREEEAARDAAFVTSFLRAQQPSALLTEVRIVLGACTPAALRELVAACPRARVFQLEGAFVGRSAEALAETVKSVRGLESGNGLQYCDVRALAHEEGGEKEEFVVFDDAVGATRLVWKEQRWVGCGCEDEVFFD